MIVFLCADCIATMSVALAGIVLHTLFWTVQSDVKYEVMWCMVNVQYNIAPCVVGLA